MSKAAEMPTAVICDDDSMSRQIARAIFEKAGFRILAGVGTALEALDMVLDHQPDVLLLDLVMPGMSGEEILPSHLPSTITGPTPIKRPVDATTSANASPVANRFR